MQFFKCVLATKKSLADSSQIFSKSLKLFSRVVSKRIMYIIISTALTIIEYASIFNMQGSIFDVLYAIIEPHLGCLL